MKYQVSFFNPLNALSQYTGLQFPVGVIALIFCCVNTLSHTVPRSCNGFYFLICKCSSTAPAGLLGKFLNLVSNCTLLQLTDTTLA